jgi:WD40 repeat protein
VTLWEAATGRAARTLAHEAGVQALAFSADGTTLTTVSSRGLVGQWTSRDGRLERSVRPSDPWTFAALAPTARTIASVDVGDGRRVVRLWRTG